MQSKLNDIVKRLMGRKKIHQALNKVRYENRRLQLIEHILHDQESGIAQERYTDHDIIVSLTTFGKRIHDVAFTIESIMQQSMKANKIILWLDFSFEKQHLPESLIRQQKRGLEIRYCEDIRSYKKLIPSIIAYPNDAIITLDDDLLYEYDLLEHLITDYLRNPNKVYSCRGKMMLFNENHSLLPYKQWPLYTPTTECKGHYFLTSGGGTLFPPNCLDKEVLNKEVFMDICKFADDVWINAMLLKTGTAICKTYTRDVRGDDFLVNESVQDVGLRNINYINQNQNDIQIKAVFTKYDLYSKL